MQTDWVRSEDGESGPSLEEALKQVEGYASELISQAQRLKKHSEDLLAAARTGDIRDITQHAGSALEALQSATAALEQRRLLDRFPLRDYLESGAYAEELKALATRAGLTGLRAEADVIACYPAAIKIDAKQLALTIGRRRQRALRPSHVVAQLLSIRETSAKFNAAKFADLLERAYRLLSSGSMGVPVALADIYEMLSLRSPDYSQDDFALELHLLDRSGLAATTHGAGFQFSASTATHGARGFRVLNESGEEVVYSGIRFSDRTAKGC